MYQARKVKAVPTRSRIAALYFLFFCTVGVSLPFFGGFLEAFGLSGPQIGIALAVSPITAVLFPPLWGQLADRTGRPGLVLTVLLFGGALGYLAMVPARRFETLLVGLFLHAVFASSVTSVLDALALAHVDRHGGTYGALRFFGSLGFVFASLVFGFAIDRIDHRVLWAIVASFAAAGLWAATTTARARLERPPGPKASFAEAARLIRRREVALFLVATCLHWVACAPYHGTLSIHVTKTLRLEPWVVSAAASVGVAAEMSVFASWRWLGDRFSPRTWLLLVLAFSALRWWVMSWVTGPLALATLAALHAFTFGAFYLSAVAWMARCAPGTLRASGQAAFVASTFGLGGLLGYLSSGALLETLGTQGLFRAAAAAELVPLLVVALLPARPPPPPENSWEPASVA